MFWSRGERRRPRQAKTIVLLAGLLLSVPMAAVRAQDICADPNNLTFNCQFDTFDYVVPYGEVATGWTPFVEFAVAGQAPSFEKEDLESPLAPAQLIWSNGLAFTAGLYQQVEVIPGVAYTAHIGWAPYASYDDRGNRNSGLFIGRKVGIDPFGGREAASPDIVWSSEIWDAEGGVFPQLRAWAVAQRPVITVFVRAHNPQSHGNDKVWFDAVSLTLDPTQPTATSTAVLPTSTAVPPTTTAVRPTSTSTSLPSTPIRTSPSPTDTPTPTQAVLSAPTDTPTLLPSPTATAAATQADTLTDALLPTAAPTSTLAPTTAPQADLSALIPNTLLGLALFAFVGAGLLGGALILLRRS